MRRFIFRRGLKDGFELYWEGFRVVLGIWFYLCIVRLLVLGFGKKVGGRKLGVI